MGTSETTRRTREHVCRDTTSAGWETGRVREDACALRHRAGPLRGPERPELRGTRWGAGWRFPNYNASEPTERESEPWDGKEDEAITPLGKWGGGGLSLCPQISGGGGGGSSQFPGKVCGAEEWKGHPPREAVWFVLGIKDTRYSWYLTLANTLHKNKCDSNVKVATTKQYLKKGLGVSNNIFMFVLQLRFLSLETYSTVQINHLFQWNKHRNPPPLPPPCVC